MAQDIINSQALPVFPLCHSEHSGFSRHTTWHNGCRSPKHHILVYCRKETWGRAPVFFFFFFFLSLSLLRKAKNFHWISLTDFPHISHRKNHDLRPPQPQERPQMSIQIFLASVLEDKSGWRRCLISHPAVSRSLATSDQPTLLYITLHFVESLLNLHHQSGLCLQCVFAEVCESIQFF